LECKKLSAGSGYSLLSPHVDRELTFLDKLGWGRGIVRLILKGQYILKTRAAQEDKNDTQQAF
jgi:hypothetical protein